MDVVLLPLAVLYFGVVAVMASSTWTLFYRLRKVPPELTRLRVLQRLPQYRRAFLLIAVGSIVGNLSPAPTLLGASAPLLWSVALMVPWGVGVGWGFFSMARLGSEGLPQAMR